MSGGSDPLPHGLNAVLATAFDAVCVMNADGVVVGWNEVASKTFGWPREEAVGRRMSETIIPPALRAAHERGLAHFLATGEGPVLDTRIEVEALHRDGQTIPIELSITASREGGALLFVGFLRDISEERAKIERQQRALQESDHRVKNMLTVVSAIAQQTARGSQTMDDFITAFSGRLDALAASHQLLVGKTGGQVALSALAEQVLGGEVALGRARFGGPEILLPSSHVLGLSMVLHELHTNAVKYGALCSDAGQVDLDWDTQQNQLELAWVEQGQPCPSDHQSSGFGHRMIALAVKSDLKGTIERDWRPEGLSALIRFPLAA